MRKLKYIGLVGIILTLLAACGQVQLPEAAPTEAPSEEVVEAPPTEIAITSYEATSAVFTGGHLSGSTRYAKQGDSLTLTVINKSDAKCIEVRAGTSATGTLLFRKAANNLGDTHTFAFTAGAESGTFTVTAYAYKNFTGTSANPTGCSTQSGGNPWFASASYTLDNTVPDISGSVVIAPNKPAAQNGWYRDDVVVSWTCSDSGSGVKSCTPSETVTGEGSNLSRTGNVEDNVGNTNSATVNFKIDRTAPNTTADAPSGWQRNGVTVTLSASDNLSGIAKTEYSLNSGAWTTGTSIQLGEGRHTLQWRSTDVAGNLEATKTATVDIDLTAPRIDSSQSPVKNGAGWNNSNVTVSFTCEDSLSGVAFCTTPQTVAAEGFTNVRGEAVDVAGNNNVIFHPVSIDVTPPTISGAPSGTLGDNGWYVSNVTVAFTCADVGGSGIASCSSNTTLENEGAGQSVTGNAVDAAGNTNSATASGIKIDKTAPSTSDNAPSGWQTANFTLSFNATDAHSGVAFTEYSQDGGQSWTRGSSVTLSDGSHTVLYRSTDSAGNREENNTATVNVDTAAPVVTISGPASTPDTNATVSGTASDTGSGVASVTVNGTAVELTNGSYSTSIALECGSNTITAIATDGVGRTQSASTTVERTCSVTQPPTVPVWTHSGFHQPIGVSNTIFQGPTASGGVATAPAPSSSTIWNTAKGGATIPLKFNIFVDNVERTSTSADTIKSFNATKMSTCTASTVNDPVEELANAGSSSLRYSGTPGIDGQFIQNWKTSSVSADTCYRLALTTADNSVMYTFVKLRK